jgi:hypothetical protein
VEKYSLPDVNRLLLSHAFKSFIQSMDETKEELQQQRASSPALARPPSCSTTSTQHHQKTTKFPVNLPRNKVQQVHHSSTLKPTKPAAPAPMLMEKSLQDFSASPFNRSSHTTPRKILTTIGNQIHKPQIRIIAHQRRFISPNNRPRYDSTFSARPPSSKFHSHHQSFHTTYPFHPRSLHYSTLPYHSLSLLTSTYDFYGVSFGQLDYHYHD